MRRLMNHKIVVPTDERTGQIVYENEVNKEIFIDVHDDDDPIDKHLGGAPHHYALYVRKGDFSQKACDLRFHKPERGRMDQFGVPCPTPANGITVEALIAVCIDRVIEWQKGPFACVDNEDALKALRTALDCCQERTRDRVKRGVKGLLKP